MSVDTGFKRCLTAESANQMRRYEITRFNEGTPLVSRFVVVAIRECKHQVVNICITVHVSVPRLRPMVKHNIFMYTSKI